MTGELLSQLETEWNSEDLYEVDISVEAMRTFHEELERMIEEDPPPRPRPRPRPPPLYEELSPPNCNVVVQDNNNVDLPQQEPNVLELQDSDEPKQKGRRNRKRAPGQAQHHIMSERKRRQLIGQLFISLSALLPNLKKMDKTTILGEAIKHMKDLKEKVEALEEVAAKENVESLATVKRSKTVVDDHDNSSCTAEVAYVLVGGNVTNLLPEIEATVSCKTVILKLCCDKNKGILLKVIGEMEKHGIYILHSTLVPLGNSIYNHTIIGQIIKKADKLYMKKVVANLKSILHAS